MLCEVNSFQYGGRKLGGKIRNGKEKAESKKNTWEAQDTPIIQADGRDGRKMEIKTSLAKGGEMGPSGGGKVQQKSRYYLARREGKNEILWSAE